jgi:hypothetical protein
MILQSCEKDGTGPSTGTGGTPGINYSLSPPSCLINQMVTPSIQRQITFEYDSQKRLIKVKSYSDLDEDELTEYAYSGNTMTETRYTISFGVLTDMKVIVHTLNQAGLIEKSVEDNRLKRRSLNETFYYYNTSGYLMREIRKVTYDTTANSFFYHGMSYSYSGGDRIKSYALAVNSQKEVTDSSLNVSYTYHMNQIGHIEAWTEWTERTGRGSTHEMNEQISTNGSTASFAYTVGPNGYPDKLKQTYDGYTTDFDLTWKCN